MAELKDVLGGILRDVTTARVASDLFTRDVSVVYREDPQLSGFPVPRLEIREVTIDLKFAVLEVQEGDAAPTVPRDSLRARLTEFLNQVLPQALFVEDVGEALRERGFSPEVLAVPMASRVTEAANARPQLLERIMNQDSKDLAAALEDALRDHEDLWSVVETMGRIRSVRQALREALQQRMAPLAASLRADTQAPRAKLTLDVAITSQELAEIPPEKVSHVRMVTEIQNYLWHAASDEHEGAEPRLLPE